MSGVELLQAYSKATSLVSTTVNGMVGTVWAQTIGRGGLSSTAAGQWGSAIAPLVEAARFDSAVNTGAYMNLGLQEMLRHKPFRPAEDIDIRRLVGNLRNGGPPTRELMHRPVAEARSLVRQGMGEAQAIQRGERRAKNIVATDMQLAKTNMAREMISVEPELQGYRRALTGSESCGLCVVASTRRYHKKELMPIHPGCDCDPVPIIATEDPGNVINQRLLDSTHDAVADRFGEGARDLSAKSDAYREQVTVYNHGEYGPTLARFEDHQLTSASASARPDPKVLGGWPAYDVEQRTGRRIPRPDWAEQLDVEPGQPFEVRNGFYDPTIAGDGIPGPGVAVVSDRNQLFYAEYPPEMEGVNPQLRMNATVRTRLQKLQKADADAGFGDFRPSVSMSVRGASRNEVMMNSRSKRQVKIRANAGAGRIVHFNGEVSEQTTWHETGHIVGNEINRAAVQRSLGRGGYFAGVNSNAPGREWSKAMERDRLHRKDSFVKGGWSDFSGTSADSSQYPALEFGSRTKLGQSFNGVTEYGSTNPTEDFAESWRLAIQSEQSGQVATQRDENGDRQPVTFAEMYPNRMAYFRTVEDQLNQTLPFSTE